MMAITSKIESLEITQYPTITENEDGSITVDGLKAVTKLKNGEERMYPTMFPLSRTWRPAATPCPTPTASTTLTTA